MLKNGLIACAAFPLLSRFERTLGAPAGDAELKAATRMQATGSCMGAPMTITGSAP